ncbi:MAG TPA: hypothetical protein VIC04_04320 [Terriglobia bacterium]|jgi:hypothetical protein
MKERAMNVVAMLMAGFLMTGLAWAQGQRNARQEDNRTVGDKVREVLPPSEPVFTTRDVTIIQGWFRTNVSNLPPGLAKRETLPPGLQKQLIRKGTLPPGLQKKIQPLPIVLERQLVVLPTGYRRVVIAGNVILMEPTTGLIYDIIRDVIP